MAGSVMPQPAALDDAASYSFATLVGLPRSGPSYDFHGYWQAGPMISALDDRITALANEIRQQVQADPVAKRLLTLRGIGPSQPVRWLASWGMARHSSADPTSLLRWAWPPQHNIGGSYRRLENRSPVPRLAKSPKRLINRPNGGAIAARNIPFCAAQAGQLKTTWRCTY